MKGTGRHTLLKSKPCAGNPLMSKELHSVYASCNQKVYRGQCSLTDKQYFEFVMNNILAFQNEEVHIDQAKFGEIFQNNSINGKGNVSAAGMFAKNQQKVSHLKTFPVQGENKNLTNFAEKFFYSVFMPFNVNGPYENNYMLLSFHPVFRSMWSLSRQGEARAMQRLHDIATGKEGFIRQHEPIPMLYEGTSQAGIFRYKDFLAFAEETDPSKVSKLRDFWLKVYKDIVLMPELARCAVAPNTPRTECWAHHMTENKINNNAIPVIDSKLTGYLIDDPQEFVAVRQESTGSKTPFVTDLGDIGEKAFELATDVDVATFDKLTEEPMSLQLLLDSMTSIRLGKKTTTKHQTIKDFIEDPLLFIANPSTTRNGVYDTLNSINEKLIDYAKTKRIRENFNDLYSKALLRMDIAEKVEGDSKNSNHAANLMFAATNKCTPPVGALDVDLAACYLKMEMDYVDAKVSSQNPFDILSEEGMLRRLDGALYRWGPKYSTTLGFKHETHNRIMGVYTECVNYCVSKSSPAIGNYKIGKLRTKMAFPLLSSNTSANLSSLDTIYDVLAKGKGKKDTPKSVAVVDMTRYSDGYGLYRYAPPQALHLKMRQLFTENSVQNGVHMLGTCIRADAGGRKSAMKTGAHLQTLGSIGLSVPVLPKHVVHIHMTNNDKLVWVVDRSKLKYMVSAPTWKMAGERSASGGFKEFDHNAADRHAAVTKGLFPHAVSPLNPTTNFRQAYLATYKYAMNKSGSTCNLNALAEDLLGSNSLASVLLTGKKDMSSSILSGGRLSIDPKTNSFYADLTQYK